MRRPPYWLGIALVASCAARSASGPAQPTPPTQPTPPRTDAGPSTSPGEPAAHHATPSGSGAFCLIVGPKQIVVRCYWTRQTCDDQIGFNQQNGLTDASECRATPEPRCFQFKHGELCYPSAADCEKNRTAMNRHPDEQPTACAIKTAP